jgi:deazaflavin-dependent oxidoreductase (nitroreductase family)
MTDTDGPGSQYANYLADPLGVNQRIVEQYRANAGEVDGMGGPSRMLLLTTRGARSGQPRTVPMFYVADGDRCVVYASNVGAPRHPGWYLNAVAHPDVTVEVGADRFDAVAVVAAGEERERLWRLFPFQEHQRWTSRQIPVVALVRHPG